VVCRELTKKFETIYRGKIEEVIKKIESSPIKGEFVIVVGK
jgi:16S rRNA (cytidine1402-2'-O)-methyltransferase